MNKRTIFVHWVRQARSEVGVDVPQAFPLLAPPASVVALTTNRRSTFALRRESNRLRVRKCSAREAPKRLATEYPRVKPAHRDLGFGGLQGLRRPSDGCGSLSSLTRELLVVVADICTCFVFASELAVESTTAMAVWTNGWHAAVARVSFATAASQQLAKRPQSLARLSGEA